MLKRWKDSFLSGPRGPGEPPLPRGKATWWAGRVPCPPAFLKDPQCPRQLRHARRPCRPPRPSPGASYHSGSPAPSSPPSPAEQDLGYTEDTPTGTGRQAAGVPRPIWGGPDPKEGERSQSPGVPEGVTGQRWGLGPGLRSSPSPAPGRQLPLLPGRRPPSPPPRVNPEMTVLVSSLPPAPAAPTSEEAQEEGKPGKRGPAPAPTSTLSAAPPVCARPLRTCRVLLA